MTSRYPQRGFGGEGTQQKSFGDVKRLLDVSLLMTQNAVALCLCPGVSRAGVLGV